MKWFHRGHLKDPGDFANTFILCDLQALDESFLVAPSVPNWGSIGEGRDDKSVVNFAPVEEIKAAYRVAKDGDSTDGGACPIGHYFHMSRPV